MRTVSLGLDTWEMVGRVALAVALAGVIGTEREISGQPAGFRTHILVALGSALFGLVSVHAFDAFSTTGTTNVRIDVTRVASQVVVGIGFLGAGAILKEGGSIRGLTTAASLWTTAAIGLAVGLGYFGPAVAVTVATLLSLVGLRGVRRLIRRRLARDEEQVVVRLVKGANAADLIGALQEVPDVVIRSLRIDRDDETGAHVIRATLGVRPGVGADRSLAFLSDRPDVDELAFPSVG